MVETSTSCLETREVDVRVGFMPVIVWHSEDCFGFMPVTGGVEVSKLES